MYLSAGVLTIPENNWNFFFFFLIGALLKGIVRVNDVTCKTIGIPTPLALKYAEKELQITIYILLSYSFIRFRSKSSSKEEITSSI